MLALRAGYRRSLDRLVDDMWGAQPPANAERMVRIYVSQLRKALRAADGEGAEDVLVTSDSGYLLALDESAVDVLRFERLIEQGEALGDPRSIGEALAMWRDEPLSDVVDDDIAVRLRDRLDRRRLDALELRFAAEAAFGLSSSAIEELRRVIDDHPWRERLWELLIVALYRAGQHVEALRVYDDACRRLADVGLEPGRALRRISAAVAGHDERLLVIEPAGNVPAAVDRFVGRGAELDELDALLRTSRLISLIGAGGCGKTRLALEAARRAPLPAWLVELSDHATTSVVAETMLRSLGQPQRTSGDSVTAVARTVGARPVLLVIDNCEHVVDDVAATAERLLAECPRIVILATSRVALRISGETIVTVRPLDLPGDATAASVVGSAAGELLVERVRAASPGFDISDDDAAAAVRLLERLDGIPLAIELAARAVRDVGLEQLGRLVDDPGEWAAPAPRTAIGRHRSMAAALEWGHELLDPAGQDAFMRLGALLGSFDVSAAEALDVTTDMLGRLTAASMVERTPDGRYRLLVPVREFAARLLDDAGRRADVERDRNRHFLGIGADLAAGFRRFTEGEWQQVFDAARIHLLAAIDDLHRTDPSDAARTVTALLPYWSETGRYSEGLRLADRAVAHLDDPAQRGELDVAVVHMMQRGGDLAGAEQAALAGLARARASGCGITVARTLNVLGSNHIERWMLHDGARILEQAKAEYHTYLPRERFVPLINHAGASAWSGDTASASASAEQLAAALHDGRAPRSVLVFVHGVKGIVARMHGDLDAADQHLADAIGTPGISEFHRLVFELERAIVRMEQGDPLDAERMIRTAMAGSIEGSAFVSIRANGVLARAALELGDPNRARAVLRDTLEQIVAMNAPGHLVETTEVCALLAAAADDEARARHFVAVTNRLIAEFGSARDPYQLERISSLLTSAEPGATDGRERLLRSLAEFLT